MSARMTAAGWLLLTLAGAALSGAGCSSDEATPGQPTTGDAGDDRSMTGDAAGDRSTTNDGDAGSSMGDGASDQGSNVDATADAADAPVTPVGSFLPADLVIGQADFKSNAVPASITASATDWTSGSAAFDGTRLFVPDPYAHRVLRFTALPTSNGAPASDAFGQASLTANAPGATAAAWYLPQSAHTDGTTLAVAEAGGNRVLLLPTIAAAGAPAPIIVGWPDATTQSDGCAANRLAAPASAFIGGGHLLVADRGNHRVLIWNTVPTAYDTPADLVLGQNTMTSCVANDSLHTSTTGPRSAASMSHPNDVWTDGTRILVADTGNNRVLIWSKFPTVNGVPADLVIGQKSLTLARDDATSAGLATPSAIAYAGGRLYIADTGHNRVLGWNMLPTANAVPADFVLGQGDFTHVTANDDGQVGTAGTPTARTLSGPSGVAFAGDDLVVSDTLNRRVLVFRKR